MGPIHGKIYRTKGAQSPTPGSQLGHIPAAEYRTFADMVAHACGPALPILHDQWEMWKSAIIRFRLYEIAAQHYWECLVARFDSRGIHSPLHLVRTPFAELIRADWELPNTGMLIWIWQAVRGILAHTGRTSLPAWIPQTMTCRIGSIPYGRRISIVLR